MSSSILRKSLQLFDEDEQQERKGCLKGKRKGSSKDVRMEDSSKRGIKKRKKKQHISKAKTKLSKESALETYNRNKSLEYTEDSLYYLNMISNIGGKPDPKTVNTILEHNKGRSSKNLKKKETKPEEQSVFSEKDFEDFRKEYLNS
ncbi:active regulator of SIRT1-like [Saccostrea echinata]|uniref:active regulator of SIRT1-like n=1 Tax=Saccostrea echinata TaxID=191078 RepID=UPI002A827E4A|nr:active regulator of SIRT1-like [Saccostrea echinata]